MEDEWRTALVSFSTTAELNILQRHKIDQINIKAPQT